MYSTRRKILWVDDKIEFYRSQITFLETRGYSIVPLFSCSDFLNLVKSNKKCCDLVLIDEKVGGVDSLITIEEIKKINPHLPIVVIAQNPSQYLKKAASQKKVNDILTQPVNANQILSIFKKLLNPSSGISQKEKEGFIRAYSEIKTILSGNLSFNDFNKIYEKLICWEIEIQSINDEGIRQAFAGLKSDTNSTFSEFIINNYGRWVNRGNNAPLLGHNVIKREILPILDKGKCILFLLSGMRFDQYICIESALNEICNVNRQAFISNLPSSEEFSLKSFFAGKLPRDIASEFPGIIKDPEVEMENNVADEKKLLSSLLTENNIQFSEQEQFVLHIDPEDSADDVLTRIDACSNSKLICLVVDLDSHLSPSDNKKQDASNTKSKENNRMSYTESWFQKSVVSKVIQMLCSRNMTVAVTSDHGSLLCSRSTEIYNTKSLLPARRYKFGKDISADERRVLFLPSPFHFGLPSFGNDVSCIIAKENYYFSHPEKYEFYQKEYQTGFLKGGISMEEMIMPLGIFSQK